MQRKRGGEISMAHENGEWAGKGKYVGDHGCTFSKLGSLSNKVGT
jgi:hypothetical protein